MIRLSIAAVLGGLTLGTLTPLTRGDQRAPDFRMQVWGEVLSEFRKRIDGYAELRRELERELPPRRVTEDAAAILERSRRLRDLLRAARRDAKMGDLFTPSVSAAIKDVLRGQTTHATCTALLDDNPRSLGIRINDRYPTHQPLSTMPPNVLAVLPRLPDDIEYRMDGPHLILLDTRAWALIDVMKFAVRC